MIITVIVILLLVVGFMYMIYPNKKRKSTLPIRLFAHRGLHGANIPENSISAFALARKKELGVELDVHLTRDKKLVVFHDDTLKRMCGVEGKIREMSFEELKKCRLMGTEESIPLFTDVLEVLEGMPVICEIKAVPQKDTAEVCEAVAREIDNYKGFMCIESFDPFAVQWFRKNKPEVIRGQLSSNFMKNRGQFPFIKAFLMTHLLVNVFSRPDFIAYCYDQDSAGYYLCRKLFKPLLVGWTVTSKEAIKEAENNFHGIIFEDREEAI